MKKPKTAAKPRKRTIIPASLFNKVGVYQPGYYHKIGTFRRCW